LNRIGNANDLCNASAARSNVSSNSGTALAMPMTSAMPVLPGAMFHPILEQHWQCL
jgi:hypothetical protein